MPISFSSDYVCKNEHCSLIFKKHIGGEAADFRPKAGSCAFSCNHPRPNMADQNCNLGNDPSSKPLSLMCYKSITA